MNAHNSIPVIATGTVYATYLDAARKNLDALVRLSQGLEDAEFEREVQFILDVFDDAVGDARTIIEEANANSEAFGEDDSCWRESVYAERLRPANAFSRGIIERRGDTL